MKHIYLFIWLSLLLGWATSAQAQTLYEAEEGETNAYVYRGFYGGATGGALVGNMHANSYVTFTVQTPVAGTYNLALRYATAVTTNCTESLEVNGTRVQQAVFAPTGGWDVWRTQTVVVTLPAGTNTITYRTSANDTGYINLDNLQVALTPAQTYEAEAGQTNVAVYRQPCGDPTGGALLAGMYVGYYVHFAVQAPLAGYYTVALRYATALQDRTMTLSVNGTKLQQAVFPYTGGWCTWGTHTVTVALKAGPNTITYMTTGTDSGDLNLDNLQVRPVVGVGKAGLLSNNPYTQVIDSLTQHLNKGQISSGILYDRVLPLGSLHVFNAYQADTTSASHVRQAYLELTTAAYTPTSSRYSTDQLHERTSTLARRDSVPLAVLDYRFHYLDTLAIQDGLLRVQNGLYQDVPGRRRLPYLQRDLVLAAPMTETVEQSTQFYLARDLFLGNRNRSVSALLVDFDNSGAAPLNCAPGQLVAVHYATAGPKVLRITVTFTDGTQTQIRAALNVRRAVAYRSVLVPLDDVQAREPFKGYDEQIGLYGKGQVLAVLHNPLSQAERATNQPFKLRKPVIIMDGFDPNDESPLRTRGDNVGLFEQLSAAGIIPELDEQRRDLIILNFPKSPRAKQGGGTTAVDIDGGADYIERNAMVLVQLLNEMKSRLDIDPATNAPFKFTVIGPSMGGLISRYALAYMEKQRISNPNDPFWDHNTAEWISLDAPHEGANVPMAAQAYLKYYSGLAESAEANLEQRINSPAAKQMLVHHYTAASTTPLGAPGFRDRFMLALRDNGEVGSLGYPVRLRRVALANGRLDGGNSTDGTPCGVAFEMEGKLRFGPTILYTIASTFFIRVKSSSTTVTYSIARFAPTFNTSCTVFTGIINQIQGIGLNTGASGMSPRTVVNVTSGTQGSWDLAPGGWYNAQGIIAKQVPASARGEWYKLIISNLRPNHTFIPTISALGFNYRSLANYSNTASLPNPYTNLATRNLLCNDEVPFDAFYAPLNVNTKHVAPDDGALAFLKQEFSGGGLILPTPQFVDAPPATICAGGSASFALQACTPRLGLAPIVYTWTVGNGLHFGNGSKTAVGTSQTVYGEAGFSGPVQLTVVASRPGYRNSPALQQTITVGSGTGTLSLAANLINKAECGATYRMVASGTNLGNEYYWTFNGSHDPAYDGQSYIDVYVDNFNPSYTVTVSVNSICGGSSGLSASQSINERFPGCEQWLTVYPNPSDSEVNIAFIASELPTSPNGKKVKYDTPKGFKAELYDGRGKKVSNKATEVDELRLSTAELPEGLYHLTVTRGKGVIQRNLSVKH